MNYELIIIIFSPTKIAKLYNNKMKSKEEKKLNLHMHNIKANFKLKKSLKS